MLLSCLIVVIHRTRSDPTSLHSSVSYSITPVRTVTLLSCLLFVINHILFYWSWKFSFVFSVDCTCIFSHVIVLSSLFHRPYPIGSILKVQFRFQCRVDLYQRSHPCLVSSLSKTTHCPIGLHCSISYSMEITLVQLVTSLSYLLFVIDPILSDQS